MNGGTCSNLGNGLFVCACLQGFKGKCHKIEAFINDNLYILLGTDCSIPFCTEDNCFNGGTCSIQNNSPQCTCPCGYTGNSLKQ